MLVSNAKRIKTMTDRPAIFATGFGSYTYAGDSITVENDGWTFTATVHHDDTMGAPWKEHDGHGEVSDWTRRDKAPGELVLSSDRDSKRFYDFASACALALRDGWGSPPYDVEGETPKQKAARAARHDFEVLRAWCNDEWFWCGIVVTVSRDDIELGSASLWGTEANYPGSRNEYLLEVANEIADEALAEAQAAVASLCDC